MYSEVQYPACLFVFLCVSHSVAVAAWSGIRHLEPQKIHFELFLSPGIQEELRLPNIITFSITQLKNIFLVFIKKVIILAEVLFCFVFLPTERPPPFGFDVSALDIAC